MGLKCSKSFSRQLSKNCSKKFISKSYQGLITNSTNKCFFISCDGTAPNQQRTVFYLEPFSSEKVHAERITHFNVYNVGSGWCECVFGFTIEPGKVVEFGISFEHLNFVQAILKLQRQIRKQREQRRKQNAISIQRLFRGFRCRRPELCAMCNCFNKKGFGVELINSKYNLGKIFPKNTLFNQTEGVLCIPCFRIQMYETLVIDSWIIIPSSILYSKEILWLGYIPTSNVNWAKSNLYHATRAATLTQSTFRSSRYWTKFKCMICLDHVPQGFSWQQYMKRINVRTGCSSDKSCNFCIECMRNVMVHSANDGKMNAVCPGECKNVIPHELIANIAGQGTVEKMWSNRRKCCKDYLTHIKKGNVEKMTWNFYRDHTRACPNCFVVIYKDGGCPNMYCHFCGTSFNWEMDSHRLK